MWTVINPQVRVIDMNNDTGPPSGVERVKEWLSLQVVILLMYIGLGVLMLVLSSNLGKVKFSLPPPPHNHAIAMVNYDQHYDHRVGNYNYRL